MGLEGYIVSPPVKLKCLSEKRRGEIAALVGGTKAARRG
jgi:hypothetical protein